MVPLVPQTPEPLNLNPQPKILKSPGLVSRRFVRGVSDVFNRLVFFFWGGGSVGPTLFGVGWAGFLQCHRSQAAGK